MTFSIDDSKFVQFLIHSWHIQPIQRGNEVFDKPLESRNCRRGSGVLAKPIDAQGETSPSRKKSPKRQTPLFSGQTPWMQIYCFEADMPWNLSQMREFFKVHPDTAAIFLHPGEDEIDIYVQSALDVTPIVIQGLDWEAHPEFTTLIELHSFLEFTFELDRRLGRRCLEQKFVQEFRKYYQKLGVLWEGLAEDTPEIRQRLSLDTMLRLFFVAFLAARGTLDKRPHFLIEEAHRRSEMHQSVYRDFLQPLFFETLNRPVHQRTQRARELGNIPFLNGGLFTPTQIETTSTKLNVPNAFWIEMITHLFEPYTLSPDQNGEFSKLNLDPMMLGHVFESLMSQNKRSATGSYYTPLPLARSLALDALQEWFRQEFSLNEDQLDAIFSQDDFSSISPECAQNIDNRLSEIAILDPAVGSGAFLQSALKLLHQLRTGLKQRCGEVVHAGTLARHILAKNLYGVDIIPMANQLCELRLWLELIHFFAPSDPLPSLPNLDLNIQCGNTLTDLSQYAQILDIPKELRADAAHLAHLKHRYRLATGYTKKKLARQIHEEMQQNSRTLFDNFIHASQLECHIIEQSSRSLFGQRMPPTPAQQQKLVVLKQQQEKLQNQQDSGQMPGFSFDIQFADILSKGGFDIILGNPPWYSLHTMPKESQTVLKSLYQTASPTNGFRAQSADISALFVEKSLQCIRPDGIVHMLIPNKLFYAPSYENFRKHLQNHTTVLQVKDWTCARHNAFAAATYPASLMLRRGGITQAGSLSPIPAIASHTNATPLLKFPKGCPSIDDAFQIKRGLCTGANAIFIGKADPALSDSPYAHIHFDGSPQEIPIEKACIYPILKGSHLLDYQYASTESLLFTHEWQDPSKVQKTLPPNAMNWLTAHETELHNRKGLGNKRFYSLFGCSEHLTHMKVVWRDISVELNACFIPDPRILPINTVYYIPVQSEDEGYLLAAYLNSSIAREFCKTQAEHAQNGYRRYFAWVVGKLPWIFDNPENRKAITKIIELSRLCHCSRREQIPELQREINRQIAQYLHPNGMLKPSRQTRFQQKSLFSNEKAG